MQQSCRKRVLTPKSPISCSPRPRYHLRLLSAASGQHTVSIAFSLCIPRGGPIPVCPIDGPVLEIVKSILLEAATSDYGIAQGNPDLIRYICRISGGGGGRGRRRHMLQAEVSHCRTA